MILAPRSLGGLLLLASLPTQLGAADTAETKIPKIARVSIAPDGGEFAAASDEPAVSANGRWIAFVAHTAVPLTPEDEENTEAKSRDIHAVYLHDRIARRTIAVSEHNDSAGQDWSFHPSLSGDGRFVAYERGVAGRRAACADIMFDIFLFDRETGQTTRISTRPDGGWSNGDSYEPRISADGRFIVFRGDASDLVADDEGGKESAFLFDRDIGRIVRVDRFAREAGRESRVEAVAISPNARFVAFRRRLVVFADRPTDEPQERYVYDRESAAAPMAVQTFLDYYGPIWVNDSGRIHDGRVEQVRDSLDERGIAHADLEGSSITSADGRVIAFAGERADLVPGDGNGHSDVFVVDLGPPPPPPTPTASRPAAPPTPPGSGASRP